MSSREGIWRGPPLSDNESALYWEIVNLLMRANLALDHYGAITDRPRDGVVEAADFVEEAINWLVKGCAP